jgi:hypothetical protein
MSQISISHPALPTLRTISALTINIPDPIIDPATISMPSVRVKLRFNPVVCSINVVFGF